VATISEHAPTQTSKPRKRQAVREEKLVQRRLASRRAARPWRRDEQAQTGLDPTTERQAVLALSRIGAVVVHGDTLTVKTRHGVSLAVRIEGGTVVLAAQGSGGRADADIDATWIDRRVVVLATSLVQAVGPFC
jgi:hypothetical protein